MISNRQLFHEDQEQEVQNETLEELEQRMQECTNKIQDNFDYFFGGIQAICETHKPNQND